MVFSLLMNEFVFQTSKEMFAGFLLGTTVTEVTVKATSPLE
jgi:hypothetical protein